MTKNKYNLDIQKQVNFIENLLIQNQENMDFEETLKWICALQFVSSNMSIQNNLAKQDYVQYSEQVFDFVLDNFY